MTTKSKFVQAMLSDFLESHGLDESGKLTVINESKKKATDELLAKIVLEKSVALFDKLEEDSTAHLTNLADEISFQELNGDGSHMTTDLDLGASADQGSDDAGADLGADMGGDMGGMNFDLPESIEEFDLSTLFAEEEDKEEELEDGEEELKEFSHDDLSGDFEDEQSQDDGSFSDLDVDFDKEGGDLEDPDADLGLDGDMGSDPDMSGGDDLGGDDMDGGEDPDMVNLDDGDEFDFNFDLPGEDLPLGKGDDLEDEDDLNKVDESKKKGTTKKMGIVPNDRSSSKAKLAK